MRQTHPHGRARRPRVDDGDVTPVTRGDLADESEADTESAVAAARLAGGMGELAVEGEAQSSTTNCRPRSVCCGRHAPSLSEYAGEAIMEKAHVQHEEQS
ncbi:hypothetical protein GCM10022230_11360 [Pseudoclavibacter caeni]